MNVVQQRRSLSLFLSPMRSPDIGRHDDDDSRAIRFRLRRRTGGQNSVSPNPVLSLHDDVRRRCRGCLLLHLRRRRGDEAVDRCGRRPPPPLRPFPTGSRRVRYFPLLVVIRRRGTRDGVSGHFRPGVAGAKRRLFFGIRPSFRRTECSRRRTYVRTSSQYSLCCCGE